MQKTGKILELPWPPSINSAWKPRKGGRGMYMTDVAKKWRADAILLLRYQLGRHKTITRNVEIQLALTPPRDSGDIDNRLKAIFDALEHARVIRNDRQIKRIVVDWKPPRAPGFVRLRISPITGDHDE